jgi:predicted secreted protein
MELGPESNGAALNAKVGETITVRLPESPMTGFRWRPDLDADRIQITADQYQGPDQPRGAPGVHLFGLLPTCPGVTALRLVKERSWEGKPTDEFAVTLDVQPG